MSSALIPLLVRTPANHDLYIGFLLAAHDLEIRLCARRKRGDEIQHARRVGDRFAFHRNENVAELDPRLVRGRPSKYFGDERATNLRKLERLGELLRHVLY